MALDKKGQALTEYIIILSAVVLFFLILKNGLTRLHINEKLSAPLTTSFKHAYQFGHPRAIGPDESGGPKKHPRFEDSGNFRIFFNPHTR